MTLVFFVLTEKKKRKVSELLRQHIGIDFGFRQTVSVCHQHQAKLIINEPCHKVPQQTLAVCFVKNGNVVGVDEFQRNGNELIQPLLMQKAFCY